MNEYELNSCIDWIRYLSNINYLELMFLSNKELLMINYEGEIDNFSLSNLKKLLSVIKKERLRIKKIEIKF